MLVLSYLRRVASCSPSTPAHRSVGLRTALEKVFPHVQTTWRGTDATTYGWLVGELAHPELSPGQRRRTPEVRATLLVRRELEEAARYRKLMRSAKYDPAPFVAAVEVLASVVSACATPDERLGRLLAAGRIYAGYLAQWQTRWASKDREGEGTIRVPDLALVLALREDEVRDGLRTRFEHWIWFQSGTALTCSKPVVYDWQKRRDPKIRWRNARETGDDLWMLRQRDTVRARDAWL